MILKIYKQQKAEQDLIAIWLYTFENFGITQADKYLDQIGTALQHIAQNPEIGVNSDSIRLGYRKYHVKEHTIFYKIEKPMIQVIRVLGNDMDYLHHLE